MCSSDLIVESFLLDSRRALEINNIIAKYWKQGFYDELQEGSVEITEEYWQELLDGQSSGKEIRENESGYPVLVDHEYTLDELKEMKIADINAYDKSDAVNSFTLSGKRMWLTKEDRVGLVNSIFCHNIIYFNARRLSNKKD